MCNSDTNDLSRVQAVNSPGEAKQPEKRKMLVCQFFISNAGEWLLEVFKPVGVHSTQSSLMGKKERKKADNKTCNDSIY